VRRFYFPIPKICFNLTHRTKKETLWSVNRSSLEDKMSDILYRTEDIQAEMEHQEALSNSRVYRAFNKGREAWKNISFFLAFINNIVTLMGLRTLSEWHSYWDGTYDGYDSPDEYWRNSLCPDLSTALANFDRCIYVRWPQPSDKYCNGMEFDLNSTSGGLSDLQEAYAMADVGGAVAQFGACYVYTNTYFNIANFVVGLMQIALSLIIFTMYVITFTPLVIREKHRRRALRLNLVKGEYAFGKIPRTSLFYFMSFAYAVTDPVFLYNVLYVVFAGLGAFVTPLFFAFHLLDLLARDPVLQSVLNAVRKPVGQLAKTLLLCFVIMYIYACIAFVTIMHQFVAEDNTHTCTSPVKCFLFVLYNGIFPQMPQSLTSVEDGAMYYDDIGIFSFRIIYDFSLMLIIGLFLLSGVFAGIIIDTFGAERDSKKEIQEDIVGTCFVCGIDRTEFDRKGEGFDKHIKEDHNLWKYIALFIHLRKKPVEWFDGPESYVKAKIDKNDISFLPLSRALALAESDSDDELDKVNAAMADRVSDMHSRLRAFQNSTRDALAALTEQVAMLSGGEAAASSGGLMPRLPSRGSAITPRDLPSRL